MFDFNKPFMVETENVSDRFIRALKAGLFIIAVSSVTYNRAYFATAEQAKQKIDNAFSCGAQATHDETKLSAKNIRDKDIHQDTKVPFQSP